MMIKVPLSVVFYDRMMIGQQFGDSSIITFNFKGPMDCRLCIFNSFRFIFTCG